MLATSTFDHNVPHTHVLESLFLGKVMDLNNSKISL